MANDILANVAAQRAATAKAKSQLTGKSYAPGATTPSAPTLAEKERALAHIAAGRAKTISEAEQEIARQEAEKQAIKELESKIPENAQNVRIVSTAEGFQATYNLPEQSSKNQVFTYGKSNPYSNVASYRDAGSSVLRGERLPASFFKNFQSNQTINATITNPNMVPNAWPNTPAGSIILNTGKENNLSLLVSRRTATQQEISQKSPDYLEQGAQWWDTTVVEPISNQLGMETTPTFKEEIKSISTEEKQSISSILESLNKKERNIFGGFKNPLTEQEKSALDKLQNISKTQYGSGEWDFSGRFGKSILEGIVQLPSDLLRMPGDFIKFAKNPGDSIGEMVTGFKDDPARATGNIIGGQIAFGGLSYGVGKFIKIPKFSKNAPKDVKVTMAGERIVTSQADDITRSTQLSKLQVTAGKKTVPAQAISTIVDVGDESFSISHLVRDGGLNKDIFSLGKARKVGTGAKTIYNSPEFFDGATITFDEPTKFAQMGKVIEMNTGAKANVGKVIMKISPDKDSYLFNLGKKLKYNIDDVTGLGMAEVKTAASGTKYSIGIGKFASKSGARGSVSSIIKIADEVPKIDDVAGLGSAVSKTTTKTTPAIGMDVAALGLKTAKTADSLPSTTTSKISSAVSAATIIKEVSGFASPVVDIAPPSTSKVVSRREQVSKKALESYMVQALSSPGIKEKSALRLKSKQKPDRDTDLMSITTITPIFQTKQTTKLSKLSREKQALISEQITMHRQTQKVANPMPVWLSPKVFPGDPVGELIIVPRRSSPSPKKKEKMNLPIGWDEFLIENPVATTGKEIRKALEMLED